MPSERYIPPSEEEVRKWEEEKEAKQKLNAQRYALIESALRKLKKDELIELLMGLDTFDPAVRWSIEFMKKASYQVECSDEGLMVEQIEACLTPLIQAVADDQVQFDSDWAIAMSQADGTGSICRRDLERIVRGVDSARPDSAR